MHLLLEIKVSEIRHKHFHDLFVRAVKIAAAVVRGQLKSGVDALCRADRQTVTDLIGLLATVFPL